MNLAGHKTIVPTLLKKMFVYISGRVYNKIFTVLSEEITSYFSQKLHNAFVILKKLLKFRLFEVL